MSITTSQVTAIADNIAKTMVDMQAAYITSPTNNAPTISTITSGQSASSNSLAARVLGIDSLSQVNVLADKTLEAVSNVIGYMALGPNTFYALPRGFLNQLETLLNGVNAYLQANSLQVHPEFAAAFNFYALNAVAFGLRTSNPDKILPAHIFPAQEQTLASFSVTGASAGTFSAGTDLDLTKYAPQRLYLKNTDASQLDSGVVFHVTYLNASGNSANFDFTLASDLAAGDNVAIGSIVGSRCTNITVSSGTNGSTVDVIVKPLRTIAY